MHRKDVKSKTILNDKRFHQRLKDLLDSNGLLVPPADLSPFSHDASRISSPPSLVLQPRTTTQIAEIVQLAHRYQLPITIRGGGTGLDGGAVPTRGGLLLSLEQMKCIKEISTKDMMAIVQPGVSVEQLNKQLQPQGLLYPIDPAGQTQGTIGGDVATRAHGLRGIKYGSIGNYILGLETIVAPGEVIRCGARTLKCATGYHLTDLFTGSRGRLGVISEIILKLVPNPQRRAAILAVLDNSEQAARFRDALRKKSIRPARMELMNAPAVHRGMSDLQLQLLPDHVLLLMELDGAEFVIQDDVKAVLEILTAEGASEIRQAEEDKESLIWWGIRGKLLTRLVRRDVAILLTVIVPGSKTSRFFQQIAAAQGRGDEFVAAYGHLGEERWHVVIAAPGDDQRAVEGLVQKARTILKTAVSFGGLKLRPYAIGIALPEAIIPSSDPGQMKLWKILKARFDPLSLFNPLDERADIPVGE